MSGTKKAPKIITMFQGKIFLGMGPLRINLLQWHYCFLGLRYMHFCSLCILNNNCTKAGTHFIIHFQQVRSSVFHVRIFRGFSTYPEEMVM